MFIDFKGILQHFKFENWRIRFLMSRTGHIFSSAKSCLTIHSWSWSSPAHAVVMSYGQFIWSGHHQWKCIKTLFYPSILFLLALPLHCQCQWRLPLTELITELRTNSKWEHGFIFYVCQNVACQVFLPCEKT